MIDKLDGSEYRTYTEQEILDNFPKQDFYVVFGTSHSAGWCDNGVERVMSREKNWPTQLEKMCGKPVFNLSIPGVTPQTMLEMVCEFNYYYHKQNAKCLGAFIEPRAADHSIMLDVSHKVVNQTHGDKYVRMAKHHVIALGRDYITKDLDSNYYNIFNVARQINGANYQKYKGDLPNETIKWIKDTVVNQMLGSYLHFDSLNLLLRMTQVLHSSGIENHTFYWETHVPELDNDNDTKQIQLMYFNAMSSYINRGINYIRCDDKPYLNKRSFDMIKLIEDKTSYEFLQDNYCKCMHYNEKVHKIAAEIIYEKVLT